MLSKRIIPCLDVRAGKLTKGVKFQGNVDIGDPVETARRYYEQGADEIVFYDITASAEGRGIFLEVVERVAESIAEGRPIAEPLEESGVFPNMVVQMINVGESVGALDTMLEKIADFYDEEVDQAVENLTAMIEPFMMVFLGGLIGGLVVAMYLPIFKIASVV